MENPRKKILSWDCANKSLGWAYLSIDLDIFRKLDVAAAAALETIRAAGTPLSPGSVHNPQIVDALLGHLVSMNRIFTEFIQFHSAGVADVLCGKKVKDTVGIERTKLLYNYLRTTAPLAADCDYVLIEDQPSVIMRGGRGPKANNKSSIVAAQLAMYYAASECVYVSPKLKGGLTLRDGLELGAFVAAETERARYKAQKKHSVANFEYLLEMLGTSASAVAPDVRRARMADLADAVMQTLAWLADRRMFRADSIFTYTHHCWR